MKLAPHSRDMLSAALRHMRDAEHLGVQGSPRSSLDQAFHLAGFGPECARKATLSTGQFDKVLGHDLGSASEAVLDTIESLDPMARRYLPRAWSRAYPALSGWKPDVRYERTGRRTSADVDALLRAARAAVDGIVFRLWMDGVLEVIE